MKRAIVAVAMICVGVGITVDRIAMHLTASAAGSGGQLVGDPPCADLNDDGVADVSDAVWLLQYLFSGGPPPECQPGGHIGLPDTGQTLCYDANGNEVPCDTTAPPDSPQAETGTPPCLGQDGLYATGCPTEGRFVDNEDGTVTDTCTGLMWQKEVGNEGITLEWCPAVAYCEDLSFAGYDDWRLPNIRELESIVDYGRVSPSIDPVFGLLPDYYWSSSSGSGHPWNAWVVLFNHGHVSLNGKSGDFYVRAVRTVQ